MDFTAFDRPPADAGPEQLAPLIESVDAYLTTTDALGNLRGTGRFLHPIFGPLDAHGWHCMFALHLLIHRRQLDHLLALGPQG